MPSGIPWLWKSSEGKVKSKGRSSLKSIGCLGRGEGLTEMQYNPLSPPKLFDKDSYALPYSEHACFSELEDFMHTMHPSTVIGIVSSSFCYVNPRHHFRHFCLDSNANDDRTPIKNKCGDNDKFFDRKQEGHAPTEGDNDKLTPKRRRNGSVNPEERKVRIYSSSLYRSRVTMKRRECCGARIHDTEEHIGVA
jgi:DNA cross-link repair 1B protein